MALLQKSGIYFTILTIFLVFTHCKTQNGMKAPFSITEKSYFYWVGGKKGSNGTSIKITGNFETTNVEFPKLYFQNKEYQIVPEITGNKFTLVGNHSAIANENIVMHSDPKQEFGNQPSSAEKKIPFELEKNEAILVYSINGKDFYFKVTDIKQLETVTYP
jgi:hypothetical protein